MFAQTIGKQVAAWRDWVARELAGLGIGPNALTIAGFIFTMFGALCIGAQWRLPALAFLALAGFCDMLDGAVARLANQRTPFGAILDSTLDRYSDTVIFVGILYGFLNQTFFALLTVIALAGSLATSYVRARAENLVPECRAGFWERGERFTFILFGLTFNHLGIVILVLALFTNVTVLQRLMFARWELARAANRPHWPTSESTAELIFWNYDRGTWQYDVAVMIFFAAAVLVPL